ncbi:MAG: hypothetical protein EOO29_49995 [Comamonadaceae bacterium]|nr:MAG: hypothetical protein EOO29_49995 [Comamonadaceae bacterium]
MRKRYQGSVLNPVVQPMPSAARVSIHALVGQDLVRFDVVLRPDGSFTADKVVLEKDLPMPYAL